MGSNSGVIDNSYAQGNVSGMYATGVGGLLGSNNAGTINNSYATGNVDGGGSSSAVGGLVGSNNSGFDFIRNSYATGNVANGGGIFSFAAGGLVGSNMGTISDSYATGSVASSSGNPYSLAYVGGLVGLHQGTITNSYAVGAVSGRTAITNTIVTANTTSTGTFGAYVGGLVGFDTFVITGGGSRIGRTTNSYWDVILSGQTTSAGGTGLTTMQMKQQINFTGWDFINTWQIAPNVLHPTLRAFNKPTPAIVATIKHPADPCQWGTPCNDKKQVDGNIEIDSLDINQFLDIADATIKAIGYASNVVDAASLLSMDFSSFKALVSKYSAILKSSKGYTKVLKGASPDALLDALVKLPTEDADKIFYFLANNDTKGLAAYLKTTHSSLATLKNIFGALETLGKFFTALTVTTELSELSGKVMGGQATTESYLKAGLNSGVAIGTWIAGGTAAAAGGLIYAAIPLGKLAAEMYDGETFEDSQQRYLTGIVQMQATLSMYDNGTVAMLARNGSDNLAGDIKTRTESGRANILSISELVEREISDLNSAGSRLAHGFNFSGDQREKIVSELKKMRDELNERFTQYETITTHLALIGAELHETAIKIEITNKAK